MALFRLEHIGEDMVLGLWRIEETLEALTETVDKSTFDLSPLEDIHNVSRKKQWLAVRCLLAKMRSRDYCDIAYDKEGRPSLPGHPMYISITHSSDMVGVLLNRLGHAGIDLQHFSPKIEKIKTRFLSESELEHASGEDELDKLHVYWCAKEALFKWMRASNVHFNEDLKVAEFDMSEGANLSAVVLHGGMQKVAQVRFEKIDEYTLAYVLNN